MAIVLAVTRLFDLVVAKAGSESTPSVPQVFGWRELAKHPVGPNAGTARRIVWIPGDDSNGDLGEIDSARQPGRNPRPLATLDELVTVYLEAVDLSSAMTAETERAQYQAARELFDAWLRWVHLCAPGTFEVKSATWQTAQKERRFGASIRVVLAVQAMVPDVVLSTIGTDARAEWTLEVSENTETGNTKDA